MKNTCTSLFALVALVLSLTTMAAFAAEEVEPFSAPDKEDSDHYNAIGFGLPVRPAATTFDASKRENANFTSFSGGELEVQDGAVTFTIDPMTTETLGWGNADGKQPPAEQWTMPEEIANVVLHIRQSHPDPSNIRMRYTRYGKPVKAREGDHVDAVLEGYEPLELRFEQPGYYSTYGAPADGLSFEITNTTGQPQDYAIEWIRIEQPRRKAYVRHEFTLPDEPVVRAKAEVSGMDHVRWYRRAVVKQELWINGQKVERLGDLYYMRTSVVDIAPYLKPGKNVIGMYGYGVLEPPFLYVEATVAQPSGVTSVMTEPDTWTYAFDAEKGWSTPEFDASGWETVTASAHSSAEETPADEPEAVYVWRKPDLFFEVADGSLPLPNWLGLIELYGDEARELVYRNDREAVVNAVVPKLQSMSQPYVEYTLNRTKEDGTDGEVVLAQRVTEHSESEAGTLAFALPLGQLDSGVYTITTRVGSADGEVLETRPREPLLVVSHIDQPMMEGDDPYAALTLDESDSLFIDFTDKSYEQGTQWIETEPAAKSNESSTEVASWDEASLKTLNGETYRETAGKTRGSMFSYRFEGDPSGDFKYIPGEFYLFELVYPDDAMRHMEVSVSSTYPGLWNNSQAGVGIDTGDKYMNTNQMQTLRWIHVADAGTHTIDVINAQETRHTTPEPRHAAAKSIRITRIVGPLPKADAGKSRQYGVDTERTAPNSGIGKNFGIEKHDDGSGTLQQRLVRMIRANQATVDRYIQYMRFSGQNTHVIGMWQYHDTNTPYKRPNPDADGRVDPTIRNVLAHTFDANDISFYAGLEISQLSNLNTSVTDGQVAAGTQGGELPQNDSVMMVDREGKQFDAAALFTYTQNWMHPVIQDGYHDVIQNVASKWSDLDNFRGIHFQMSWAQRSEYYLPGFSWRERSEDPFVYSFDDVTFQKFYDDTGIDIHVGSSDPDRFAKRHEAVANGEHREAFVEWRNQELKEFMASCVVAMQAVDEDLEWANLLNIDEVDLYRVWEKWLAENPDVEGNAFNAFFRDYGLDIPLLNEVEDMTVGRSAMGWREMPNSYDTGLSIFGQQNPYHWWARTDERIAEAFDDDSEELRYVLIRNSWDENAVVGEAGMSRGERGDNVLLEGEKDWVIKRRRIRAMPQPRAQHAREPLIQSIILSDPNLLLGAFLDLNVNVGHVDGLLPLVDTYTKLPPERFERVLDTGLTTNFAISKLTRGGKTWFYVANPGYWAMPGTLVVQTDGDVRSLDDDSVVSTANHGKHKLELNVEPYNLQAFYVDSTDVEIHSYETGAIDQQSEDFMRGIIQSAGNLLPEPQTTETEQFVAQQLEQAQAALDAREFAQAWSLLTNPRFWTWKFRAERPGIYIALPMWRDEQ